MKKIFGLIVLILILWACSMYNYESSYHAPTILYESEIREHPELWEYYVHDAYGKSYTARSIDTDSNSISGVIQSTEPIELPEKLYANQIDRKNEIHVFVNDSNLVPDSRIEFNNSEITEVMMYSDLPKEPGDNLVEDAESAAILILSIIGIVLVSIGLALLMVWLFIESFLNSVGCYIATMAYGSYDAPEVRVLRRFRDEVLKKTFIGRVCIANYYAFSPLLVKFVKKTGFAEKFIRRRLDRFVIRLRQKHNW